ncbi:FecR family protein [Zobellia galactanivorans]|uniref:Anti-sigma factor n=1 Tax=Zobellia galactanivorans (strain DSM 12802 / CCUG 47099 / CIP 106680 / NCIMB 13871 / Dsij) TaxID=63186 RepID=G0L0X9_ZOBGA|nr:FecR family protein [Zobellia galactanivorans]CAZ94532.1 Anti-sigma factor [Zobellia galactanivorans]
MKPKKLHRLIVKYITAAISKSELDELEIELKQPSNIQLFNEYVKLNYRIDSKMKIYDTEKSKRLLLDKIREDKRKPKKIKLNNYLKYAALIVLSMTIGYLVKEVAFEKPKEAEFTPTENFITLEREDGNIQVISEDGSTEILDTKGNVVGSQVGNQLVYKDNNESETSEPVYNTLHVPYGKRFELKLEDGSIAYLNSGSSLKYPVRFQKGMDRKIYLMGEAFLEVAKDKERPFIVNASDLNVKVYGTKFNVSAYPEDSMKQVVLVEGSVGMYSKIKSSDVIKETVLTPGTLGSYDNALGDVSTQPVVTSIYTSWVQGVLVFRNISFEDILKKLERHYDVKIINQNSKMASETFNASFGDMPIEKILEYFKSQYDIDYIINKDTIIVK